MDYSELFGDFDMYFADELMLGLGTFLVVLVLIVLAFLIVVYVLQAIGLMRLAKKHDLPNPWLAWIPVGCMYLLGKLGFEVYAPENKKNETFTWILFSLSAATLLLSDSGMSYLIEIALTVFVTWAYYNIFAKINPKNSVIFTILTAIFNIGGVILFFNTKKVLNENVSNEETKNVEKPKFCPNCGNKLNKDSKFCGKCGQQL